MCNPRYTVVEDGLDEHVSITAATPDPSSPPRDEVHTPAKHPRSMEESRANHSCASGSDNALNDRSIAALDLAISRKRRASQLSDVEAQPKRRFSVEATRVDDEHVVIAVRTNQRCNTDVEEGRAFYVEIAEHIERLRLEAQRSGDSWKSLVLYLFYSGYW
jgi:hypothetical protein